MVVKKLMAAAAVLIALGAAGCESKEDVVTIGINQFVVHEALDASRQGFLDVLKENGYIEGENIEIDYKNAQGEQPTALTIAQDFSNSKKDLIFAIATPSAQASYNATKEIPIIITAVTDPVDAGIAESFEASGTNVTGTSDGVPIGPQLEVLKKVLPDAKTIGVIYNTSEANSIYQVEALKVEAEKQGFVLKEVGITSLSDVNSVLPTALEGIDVLYTPTDNTVASAYAIIVKLATEQNVPVFCAEDAGVNVGGLISAGLDYYELGRETGFIAIEVLEGKNPKDLPISTMKNPVIVVNEDTALKLGITIPEDILAVAKLVGGK
jgi:putative tryptophan/tyrosine transport system substrate-binding protein